MEQWLLPRDNKETRTCDACGSYKMRAQFYDWHSHPAIKSITEERLLIICLPCAKREAGSRHFSSIKNS